VVMPADFGGELRVALLGFSVCHAEMMNSGAMKENPF